ncbi:S24 family peptidase [Sphingomonas sp. MMS24-JH45]
MPLLSVAASAGPGAQWREERRIRELPFARATLRDLGIAPADASVIRVAGNSMAPTLVDGDRVLVDQADRRRGRGVFVIREGDLLSVSASPRCRAAIWWSATIPTTTIAAWRPR